MFRSNRKNSAARTWFRGRFVTIMQTPKKILIFSHAYFPKWVGGAEIALQEITNRINSDDFEFHLITLGATEPSVEKMGNIFVHRIALFDKYTYRGMLHKLAKYLFIFAAFFKGIQLQRKHKFDAFWTLMATYGGFSALFMKLVYPKKEFLLTLQEGDPVEYIMKRLGILKSVYKFIFKYANRVQAISNYLAAFAHDMGFHGQVSVIPNAVDFKYFSKTISPIERLQIRTKFGFKPDDTILVTTSRLVIKNGVGDIIYALAELPENYKLLVIGSGELEEGLRLITTKYKLENRVKFCGFIDHGKLPLYLQASDIFIRPSLSEGLGNSFLEAMAAGLPVIATPVGGIPDFLTDNETGVFCCAKNPSSIARAILKLTDTDLRNHIVEQASKMVQEKYNWDAVVIQIRLFLIG